MKIYVAPVLASFGKVTNQTESAFQDPANEMPVTGFKRPA